MSHVVLSLSPDRAGHSPLPLRVLGHPLPAAQASGGGAVAPAACRPLLQGVCGFHGAVVSLQQGLWLPLTCPKGSAGAGARRGAGFVQLWSPVLPPCTKLAFGHGRKLSPSGFCSRPDSPRLLEGAEVSLPLLPLALLKSWWFLAKRQ